MLSLMIQSGWLIFHPLRTKVASLIRKNNISMWISYKETNTNKIIKKTIWKIKTLTCPLVPQRFLIPPWIYSIFFFSSVFRGMKTPYLGLLYFPFVIYQNWWRMMWRLASMTHWLIFVRIHSWMMLDCGEVQERTISIFFRASLWL